MLQREALNYGLDLEPQRYEQDEPARMLPETKELHTEAGRILAVPSQNGQQQLHRQPAEDVPPHMPHARWETATTMTLASSTATNQASSEAGVAGVASGHFVYTWQLGEWSKCSQECGAAGSGLQVSSKQAEISCGSYSTGLATNENTIKSPEKVCEINMQMKLDYPRKNSYHK